ncbi:hypothetical protein BZG36_05284 [Bifiguratus adelaidae]|uniref:Alpha-N-acetylglucosaminidase n=1 Tax=Bifiguratus adelaidae TaxID=1938954 RepID=A0A261XUR2_9FUNG|nr:hypothetical protein BZG36_05284 [Bifiguratus adelaidae]
MVGIRSFGALALLSFASAAVSSSTAGIEALVARRLPHLAHKFHFELSSPCAQNASCFDSYTVSSVGDKIKVSAETLSGLNRGLYAYLTEIAGGDIYWTGSYLDVDCAPPVDQKLTGSSVVKWRYYFNTVTFSYTAAFWHWEDWELQLDWLALRGVNLPLAWVGFEKTLIDTYRWAGLTDAQISTFLSGPAFQAWNRFGNIQGSWNGTLPMSWVNDQFILGKKIVDRMVELGMTPVMPAFAGFVPRAFPEVDNSPNLVNSSDWSGFPTILTNDTLLEPQDAFFTKMQQYFVTKQKEDFGNVSSIYTIDQFNELTPASGNTTYLATVSNSTIESLKAADPNAVWMMQGWLFFSASTFWTAERIQAFLGGVSNNEDMLILDLFSEVQPQWQRTQSYFGKNWIWCFLHDYGGNMGLYGSMQNETVVPMEALAANPNMVGMGVTMEGQEGNEVTYDLFLDQAWSKAPIDTASYVQKWVQRRYSGKAPQSVFQAWDILRTAVYSNENANVSVVPKSILGLAPAISGLFRFGAGNHHPTVPSYDPQVLIGPWRLLVQAAFAHPHLLKIETFHHDLTDVTRQVVANAFIPAYVNLISTWNQTGATSASIRKAGQKLTDILTTLDKVLYTSPDFLLSRWISKAVAWAKGSHEIKTYYEYNARNQITLWGPEGQINDYASKDWAGLVGQYYKERWELFVKYLATTTPETYNATVFGDTLLQFEQAWNGQRWSGPACTKGNLLHIIETDPLLQSLLA